MTSAGDTSALQGRVFLRTAHFATRSDAHKAQVAALREQLRAPACGLFTSSAAADPAAPSKQPQPQQSQAMQQQLMAAAAVAAAKYSAFTTSGGVKGELLLRKIFQKLSNGTHATTHERAEQFFDALVLSGFVTPLRDVGAPAKLSGFYEPKALFAPTNHDLNGKTGKLSVWEVREGAIQAGLVCKPTKTYAGLARQRMGYAHPTVYALANSKHKALYFFDSDCALQYTSKLDLSTEATVQFDETLPFGIRVTTTTTSVVISVESKEKQDEWLNSIINAGAQYREVFNVEAEGVKSFYELKDYDMSGTEVSMDKYRGKVLLVVNVSSLCALTPINYPQLAKLDEKYKAQGLEILAFPCNQFASQEPGTHDEIMKTVAKYKCQFTFFEKHDVNGAAARPVFTYLKAQLPGSFGSFVKWNFTKFLVDRNGNPVKRFAPSDAPLSFEQEIVALLEQAPAAF
jgi:glutathione peroxidase-family protein